MWWWWKKKSSRKRNGRALGGSADGRTGGPQLLNATRIAYRVAAAAPADGMNPFFCSVRGVTHGVSSLRQSLRRKNGPLCFVFRARLCVFLCVCVCVCVCRRGSPGQRPAAWERPTRPRSLSTRTTLSSGPSISVGSAIASAET